MGGDSHANSVNSGARMAASKNRLNFLSPVNLTGSFNYLNDERSPRTKQIEGAWMEGSFTPGYVACREHSTGYMSGVSIDSNLKGKIGVRTK